ncbi:Maf family protein [Thalassobacillus devorans]|uniref:Maf family protein n=1 Tax=Thalassobacillus devorans TaxID=279813 RepID=UPI000490AD49|nr:Maf family protein [Thalassobacillus devorans]
MEKSLVLGSASPRRKSLLELAGFQFEVRTSDADETAISNKEPEMLVQRLAQLKAEQIVTTENEVLVTADTVVSFAGKVLGKPETRREAIETLQLLSGKTHEVHTGVLIRGYDQYKIFAVKTIVKFMELTEADIIRYVNTGDPFDKAGSYGIQTKGALLVKGIRGDYYNVVGLPIAFLVKELEKFDITPS